MKLSAGFKRMFGRRFRAGSYAAFASVIVIAIAAAANLMVSALPQSVTQMDMTEQSIYTLSDQTKRILATLDQDVDLYLLATSGNEDDTVLRLLERYAGQSDHVKVTTIDPTQRPTFLDNYELSTSRLYANSVIVDCGGKYRLVSYDEIFVTSYSMDYSTYSYVTTTDFDGEQALTNAIHYVTSEDIPKIYALSGHGESELSQTIAQLIERDNLETESLSLLSLESVPEDAGAILINAPMTDLSADEADMLIAYLQSGGKVVLLTDYLTAEDMPNLLRVTAAMGLTVQESLIVEGDSMMHLNRYPYYLLPDAQDHEITEPILTGGYYILMPLAQPIVETEESTGASITWLLTTSDSAYGKIAGLDMTTTEREDGDTDGPFNIGAASELGEGRLVWLTSSVMLEDSVNAMVSGANSDLFLNALEWLCDQEETISIRAKSLDGGTLTLTGAQSSFWSAVMIGGIPAAFVLTGIVIWMRRKRR
ncbi:MAG: GldG family protein [Clostridia bacterium]|nr:GldG family protein [Clostridia bacterium]